MKNVSKTQSPDLFYTVDNHSIDSFEKAKKIKIDDWKNTKNGSLAQEIEKSKKGNSIFLFCGTELQEILYNCADKKERQNVYKDCEIVERESFMNDERYYRLQRKSEITLSSDNAFKN